jgi:hypothetical protein
MSRSLPLGHGGSVLLTIVAQALLLIVVCRFLSIPLLVMLMMAVSGKSRLLSAGFYTEARRRCRVAEEGFHL